MILGTLAIASPSVSAASLRKLPAPAPNVEKLHVVTTLSVLADLARTIGGEEVEVDALASPNQDPHYVAPTPVLMQKARKADVLIEVGLQLELWAEKVAAGSGNTKIQMGQPGRVIASTGVATLELPVVLSREWGDVHPYGNPHIWLDPINAKTMAGNIATAFSKLDPAHADDFGERLAAFDKRIDEALFGRELVKKVGGKKLTRLAKSGRLNEYLERRELAKELGGWLREAAPLRGRPVVTYHKTFIYLAERFGFQIPIEIEEKPGIPPSARHRDKVLELIKQQGVRSILMANYYDRTAADYLAEHSGAHTLIAAIDGAGAIDGDDYFDLIDRLVKALVASETQAD